MPIQSVIALSGSLPGKKRDDIYARAKKPAAQMVVQDDGTIAITPRQYPVRVQCLKVLYVTITRFRAIVAPAEMITASAPSTTISVTSTYGVNATEVTAGELSSFSGYRGADADKIAFQTLLKSSQKQQSRRSLQ